MNYNYAYFFLTSLIPVNSSLFNTIIGSLIGVLGAYLVARYTVKQESRENIQRENIKLFLGVKRKIKQLISENESYLSGSANINLEDFKNHSEYLKDNIYSDSMISDLTKLIGVMPDQYKLISEISLMLSLRVIRDIRFSHLLEAADKKGCLDFIDELNNSLLGLRFWLTKIDQEYDISKNSFMKY